MASFWNSGSTPYEDRNEGAATVALGTIFQAAVPGVVTGARMYRYSAGTTPHVCHLWSAGGSDLGSFTFSGDSGTGWITGSFATPISIAASTNYTISVHYPDGHYPMDLGYFDASYTVGNLTAPTSAGVFDYGTSSTRPTSVYSNTNYWVDVDFEPMSAAITGTATSSITEADIRAGNKTIIITLTGTTFVAS